MTSDHEDGGSNPPGLTKKIEKHEKNRMWFRICDRCFQSDYRWYVGKLFIEFYLPQKFTDVGRCVDRVFCRRTISSSSRCRVDFESMRS